MLRTDLSGLVKWSLNSRYAAYLFHWQTNKISQSVSQSIKQTNKQTNENINKLTLFYLMLPKFWNGP